MIRLIFPNVSSGPEKPAKFVGGWEENSTEDDGKGWFTGWRRSTGTGHLCGEIGGAPQNQL